MPQFLHHDLQLLNPRLDSPLLDVLTDLEHLRRLEIRGSTPPPVFRQLKEVFHLLESLASARIEGNHTTLADFVEAKVAPASASTEALRAATLRCLDHRVNGQHKIEKNHLPSTYDGQRLIADVPCRQVKIVYPPEAALSHLARPMRCSASGTTKLLSLARSVRIALACWLTP